MGNSNSGKISFDYLKSKPLEINYFNRKKSDFWMDDLSSNCEDFNYVLKYLTANKDEIPEEVIDDIYEQIKEETYGVLTHCLSESYKQNKEKTLENLEMMKELNLNKDNLITNYYEQNQSDIKYEEYLSKINNKVKEFCNSNTLNR